MILLHYSTLVLFFLIDDYIYSSLADQQTETISKVLKSYSNVYGSIPKKESASAVFLNKKVKRHDHIEYFTTIRSKERVFDVTTESNFESKDTKDNSISQNFNDSSYLSEEDNNENEDLNEPADHIIPFSEHENPKEPPTRPNYTAPGEWAKPSSNKNISLEFVPNKLYAQIRGTHTIKRLPRDEAIKSAETNEEKENAARLKEVVKISKSNTVYTEEGYEDAAYDHAGQIRDADFHEGYAEKVNENVDKKTIDPDNDQSINIKKLYKSRKNNFQDFGNISDYSDEDTKVTKEVRVLKQQTPKYLEFLESKSKESIIDPKTIVQDSILQLEQDLKKIPNEDQKSLKEPYKLVITTPAYIAPETESIYRNTIKYETTTLKPINYTIKPPKLTTILHKTHLAVQKNPTIYYPEIKNNSNYKNYVNNSYKNKPKNQKNENLFWKYYLNKENKTPESVYSEKSYESQTVKPIIANPLAVATVNGHGPYLVVVTDAPNIFTPSPLQNETLETKINYVAVSANNIGKSTSINPHINNAFFKPEIRNVKLTNRHTFPQYVYSAKNRNEAPRIYKEKKITEMSFNLPMLKFPSNHEKVLQYLENEKKNDFDYYKVIKTSKPSYTFDKYLDYLRKPYSNIREHWSVTHKRERPVESVYNMTHNIQRPRVGATVQESAVPDTKLLPPSPLSDSKYTSFYIQDRTRESIQPTILSTMPFIAAIHRHKNNQKSIPLFFRKKRSIGPSREWEILQREQRLKEHKNAELLKRVTPVNSAIENIKSKYPKNFENLLNEPSQIVSEEVNIDIKERFEENLKDNSEEGSDKNLNNEKKNILNKNERESDEDYKDYKNNNPVRVGVPELNFGSLLIEDKVDSTTVKSSSLVNTKKYPFYDNDKVSRNNALKYIINPIEVPKKTFGGMEFYNSRNLDCEELNPNLEKIVPEEEELANNRGVRNDKPKLYGLGDKVDCYKAKYFDENPFDNPLFYEKIIEFPPSTLELDSKKFASKILDLSPQKDEYIISRDSKYPEDFTLMKQHSIITKSPSNYIPELKNNFNNKNLDLVPKLEKRYRNPTNLILNNKNKLRLSKNLSRINLKKSKSQVAPTLYQQQVYDDVMGTIMNLENMYKTSITADRILPFHSKYHVRDYNKEKEYIEFDKPKKQRQTKIDGLIPPPQYIFNTVPLKNNKFVRSNWKNLRIFKRNAETETIENVKKLNNTLNNTNDISKINKRNIFQVIKTTPVSEKPKRKRKTISLESNESTTQRSVFTTTDTMKPFNRSEEELGRYDKFIDKGNVTLFFDSRRNEPRYNISKRTNALKKMNSITTFSPLNIDFTTIFSQSSADTSFSRSTLIPVIVKPDENFTGRIPQESKTRFIKQKLENLNIDDRQIESNEDLDNINNKKDGQNLEKINNQYLVHEKTQEEADDEKNYEVVTDFTIEANNSQEHKELVEFLKGDPPGYIETFEHQTTPAYEEIRSNESTQNEESKIKNAKDEESERQDENDTSKEVLLSENTSDDSEEEHNENLRPYKEERENLSPNSHESDNEPFARYLSRPYSPPENYEDERYSDLGPRINKPHFYHPPFKVPTYEKYILGKSVEHLNNDDWNHSEEMEDNEKYVFPWENDKDEDDEKDEESQHFSMLGKYEYPWERRDRKEKERKNRERLQKKYNKNFLENNENQQEYEEATNTKPIYVSLKKKHSRNKKDVNNVKTSFNKDPIITFTSKSRSRVIKEPLNGEKMLTNITNSDEIASIINYFQNSSNLSPKVNLSKISQKHILNDKYSVSTSSSLPSQKNDLVTKIENITKFSTPFTISKSVRNSRTPIRSRKIKTKSINNSSDKKKASNRKKKRENLPVRNSKAIHRRIKNISNTDTFFTSTKSPIKSNSRIRNRSTKSSVTPTILTLTPKIPTERHRRPLKIRSNMKKKNNLSKINQISSTTLQSIPTSTVRTIEHHSRVSKEEIITKTFYPDEDEEEDEEDIEENLLKKNKNNLNLEKKSDKYFKLNYRTQPKNDSQDEYSSKKEKVEKVTITMKETPNHVYRTKEIDKDGIKGKFITITPNNNSAIASKHNNNFQIKDAEMEEMKRRMNAFTSYDTISRDTEDLVDNPSEIHGAENYVIGNLLQKLHPTNRELKIKSKEDIHLSDHFSGMTYDNVENNDNKNDNDDDDISDDNQNLNYKTIGNNDEKYIKDHIDKEKNGNNNEEENKTEKNSIDQFPVNVIKDPNGRRYFYVERR